MNRREFLGAVGVSAGVISGCVGEGDPVTGTSDPPAPSATPAVVSGVPPCPERPDRLTRESAVRFATPFERAYLTRVTLRETDLDVMSIDVDVEDPEATATGDGWLVRVTVVGPAYRYRPDPDSTETAHVDPGLTTAHYLVTDGEVYRALSLEPVDPREHGTVVRCPP